MRRPPITLEGAMIVGTVFAHFWCKLFHRKHMKELRTHRECQKCRRPEFKQIEVPMPEIIGSSSEIYLGHPSYQCNFYHEGNRGRTYCQKSRGHKGTHRDYDGKELAQWNNTPWPHEDSDDILNADIIE